MLKIGVLVSGGGTNLQAIIDAIKNGKIKNVEIASVVSNNNSAFALKRAENEGIEAVYISKKAFSSNEEYEDALIKHFSERNIGLIVMAGFMTILGEKFISYYKEKIINIHPSLIPSFCGKGYYGLKVHEAVLEKGVKVTGATVHFVDYGTDTGPIIIQKAVDVDDFDTPESLQKKVMKNAEWIILPEAIRLFSEGLIEVQNNIVRRKDK